MTYFPLPSKPVKPVFPAFICLCVRTLWLLGSGILWTWGDSNPRPNSLTSVTLRFSVLWFVKLSIWLILLHSPS